MKYRIIMFGRGGVARFLTTHLLKTTEIVAYLDTMNWGGYIADNIPIISLEELKNYIYDYIVIAFSDVKKAYDILKEEGVKKQKIVAYTFTSSELYKNNYYYLIDTILHDELKDFVIPKLFSVSQKNFYLCTMNILESEIVESDFVREQTLHLLVNEIKRKNRNK